MSVSADQIAGVIHPAIIRQVYAAITRAITRINSNDLDVTTTARSQESGVVLNNRDKTRRRLFPGQRYQDEEVPSDAEEHFDPAVDSLVLDASISRHGISRGSRFDQNITTGNTVADQFVGNSGGTIQRYLEVDQRRIGALQVSSGLAGMPDQTDGTTCLCMDGSKLGYDMAFIGTQDRGAVPEPDDGSQRLRRICRCPQS